VSLGLRRLLRHLGCNLARIPAAAVVVGNTVVVVAAAADTDAAVAVVAVDHASDSKATNSMSVTNTLPFWN
jgi:hypothetical protein